MATAVDAFLSDASPSAATMTRAAQSLAATPAAAAAAPPPPLALLRSALQRAARISCTDDAAAACAALSLAAAITERLQAAQRGVWREEERACVLAAALAHGSAERWTTAESRRRARLLLEALAGGGAREAGARGDGGGGAVPLAATGESGAALDADALPHLLRLLDARAWEGRPALWAVVSAAVLRVRHPFMGPHVPLLLPLLLQWLEHHGRELRIIALRTTTHLVQEVNSTDLTATGVDRVLLDVVERLLFVPEADVVALALPCAASLLRAMNHNPARRPSPAHDALMAKLLKFVRWEDKLAKRRAYMAGLRPLIQTLMPVLESYCTCADLETRELALLALAETVRQAKPRLSLPKRQAWIDALLKRASLKEGLLLLDEPASDEDLERAAASVSLSGDSDSDDTAAETDAMPTPLLGQGKIEPRLAKAAALCQAQLQRDTD